MNYLTPPKLQMICMCEQVIIDSITKVLSLNRIFSILFSPVFPFKRDICFFFSVNGYSEPSANIAIQVFDRYGICVGEKTDTIKNINPVDKDLCFAHLFKDFEFSIDGIYTFKLFFNGIEYENNHLELYVRKVENPKVIIKNLIEKHFI